MAASPASAYETRRRLSRLGEPGGDPARKNRPVPLVAGTGEPRCGATWSPGTAERGDEASEDNPATPRVPDDRCATAVTDCVTAHLCIARAAKWRGD